MADTDNISVSDLKKLLAKLSTESDNDSESSAEDIPEPPKRKPRVIKVAKTTPREIKESQREHINAPEKMDVKCQRCKEVQCIKDLMIEYDRSGIPFAVGRCPICHSKLRKRYGTMPEEAKLTKAIDRLESFRGKFADTQIRKLRYILDGAEHYV